MSRLLLDLQERSINTPRLVELKLQQGRTCQHYKWCGKVCCYSCCLCCKRSVTISVHPVVLRRDLSFGMTIVSMLLNCTTHTHANADTPSVPTQHHNFFVGCTLLSQTHCNLCHTGSHPFSYNPFSNCEWNFISLGGPDWMKKLHFLCPEL